jgi:hypothetical protein
MKYLPKTVRMAACAALVLGVASLAAVPASASTGSAQARDVPAATVNLYFCDYDVTSHAPC